MVAKTATSFLAFKTLISIVAFIFTSIVFDIAMFLALSLYFFAILVMLTQIAKRLPQWFF